MIIPILDKRIYNVITILCILKRRSGYNSLEKICDELNITRYVYYDMMMKLQGLAVSSSKGTHGGYFYSGDGVTVGEIINKLGLTEDVPETIFAERLKTQMNRITRLKIEEFEEFDE